MGNKPYIPLLMLKGINAVIDRDKTLKNDREAQKERGINAQILKRATAYPFGAMKYLIHYMPTSLAGKILDRYSPGLTMQYFCRNKAMYDRLDVTVCDTLFDNSKRSPVNIISLGAGFDWRMDAKVREYQIGDVDVDYTYIDLPQVLDIRDELFDIPSLMPVDPRKVHGQPADLQQHDSIDKIIANLRPAKHHIVFAKGLMPYLDPHMANGIYKQFGKLPDTTFITTNFSTINMTDQRGEREAKHVDYKFAVPDRNLNNWLAKNRLDLVEYVKPSEWLDAPGFDKRYIDNAANIERILFAKGRGPQTT